MFHTFHEFRFEVWNPKREVAIEMLQEQCEADMSPDNRSIGRLALWPHFEQ